jgi:hypothetical protein
MDRDVGDQIRFARLGIILPGAVVLGIGLYKLHLVASTTVLVVARIRIGWDDHAVTVLLWRRLHPDRRFEIVGDFT